MSQSDNTSGETIRKKFLKKYVNALKILRSIEEKLIEEGHLDDLQDNASKRQLEEFKRFQRVRKTRIN